MGAQLNPVQILSQFVTYERLGSWILNWAPILKILGAQLAPDQIKLIFGPDLAHRPLISLYIFHISMKVKKSKVKVIQTILKFSNFASNMPKLG
jgi:hypothetical protein